LIDKVMSSVEPAPVVTVFPNWSSTETLKLVSAVPAVPVAGGSVVKTTLVGGAGVLVSAKLRGLGVVAGEVTATLYEPAVLFAVKVSELAMPFVPVTAVQDATAVPPVARHVPPLEAARKVPLAPDAGAVNVTTAPETALP
jgi:hypothetical protein